MVAKRHKMHKSQIARETAEFNPLVRSLKGSLNGAKIAKKDYHKYFEEKYLYYLTKC
jgi:hypothetical protein